MLRLCAPLLLLFLWRPLVWAAVSESSVSLPAPQNLTIWSYNFQNTLKWSPVKGINGSVSYSVEYCLASGQNCEDLNCANIAKLECDFSFIKDFFTIILRVRAEQGELKSAWVETPTFQAKQDTILGPPRAINISSEPNSLLVSFMPPFDHIQDFFHLSYSVYYWEESTSEKLTKETKSELVVLENLKQGTVYCLEIQAQLNEVRTKQLSDTYCKKTTISEAQQILYVVLVFVLVFLLFILIFLCLLGIHKYQNTIKSFWHPPLTIPSHYEEDLQNLEMSMTEVFKNRAGEDQWDTLSVMSNAEQSQTAINSISDEGGTPHMT